MSRIAAQSIALNRIGSRILIKRLLILTILIPLTIWAIYPLRERLDQQRELNSLQARMSGAIKQESHLQQEINQLQHDNDYIELMARKKLGLIMPGEDGYIVVESSSASKADQAPANRDAAPKR